MINGSSMGEPVRLGTSPQAFGVGKNTLYRISLTSSRKPLHSIRLRNTYCGTVEIQWPAHLGQQENRAQDAQKGCPARPQRAKRRRRTLRYVELLSEARTPLADFFSILVAVLRGMPSESCLH